MKASQAFQEQPTDVEALWNRCSCAMFSLEDRQKQLGLGNKVGTDICGRRLQARWEHGSCGGLGNIEMCAH